MRFHSFAKEESEGPPPPPYKYPPHAALSDPTASLRELAALASFGFSIRNTEKGRPLYILSPLTATAVYPYPPEFSDVLIRMSRLTTQPEADVSDAAKSLRTLMIASYQLNFFNALRGNTGVNNLSRHSKGVNSCMAWANANYWDWKRAEPRREIINGRTYEIPGEQYEPSPETSRRFDKALSDYNSLIPDLKDMQTVSTTVDIARAPLHRKAAAIWEKVIFPKLEATAKGAASRTPLVDVRQVQRFAAPSVMVQNWTYGMITFVSPQMSLTNVAVRVRYSNEHGDTGDWYGYLPRLDPQQYVEVQLPSTIYRAAKFSLKLDVSFSLICDQGRMMDVPVDPGQKLNTGRTIEEVRTAETRLSAKAEELTKLLPQIAPVCEDPRAASKKLVERFGKGTTYAGRWNRSIYLVKVSPFDVTSRTITMTISRGAAPTMQTLTVPAQLLTEVERGVVVGSAGGALPSISTIGGGMGNRGAPATPVPTKMPPPAVASTALGKSSLQTSNPLGGGSLQTSSPLGGGGASPPSRQVNRSTPAPAGPFNAASGGAPRDVVGAFFEKLGASSAPGGGAGREEEKGPERLVTSPAEIAHFRWYKAAKREEAAATSLSTMILTGEMRFRDLGLALLSRERTIEAEWVLSVDEEGNPWIQIRAEGEDQIDHFPLVAAEAQINK